MIVCFFSNLLLFKDFEFLNVVINKAGKGKIKDIEIKIPFTSQGRFDLARQREIARKYQQIEAIKQNVKAELEKIENIKVDIGI